MSAIAIRVAPEPVSAIHLKRILFATDFSAESLVPLPLVGMLAERYHAEVDVLYALAPASMAVPEGAAYALPMSAEAAEKMQQVLRADVLEGTRLKPTLRLGFAAETIMDEAKDFRADLIIAGTHGFGGVKHFILGSVCEDLARSAPCPVMTMGPHVHKRFARPAPPERILVPVDFSPESLDVVPYVMSLVSDFGSCVTFLHVCDPQEQETPLAQTKYFMAKMKRLFGKHVPYGCSSRYLVESGDVAGTVINVAYETYADIIAMGVRSRKDIGFRIRSSVTYKVMAGAQCPVFISHLR
jgi:nucleotide-binding universal stress UspA family protein